MAYKALYRTYRPKNFEEVVGQKYIVKTLMHAIEQNKIAHAYLFTGPRGTGKTSIAKIFAKAVNCTCDDNKPCGVCDNCLAIMDGTHPDVIEMDAASNNGVEEVRNLIEKIKYAPIKGRYKVYIIDEVHMMTASAFNALLKIIEEPPAHVIFILATTEPHKVLPTIVSRCQRYDFYKISREDIKSNLAHVLEMEKVEYEKEVLDIIASLCDGGMRDALSILDQCISYAKDYLQIHHINEMFGITSLEEKIHIFDLIASKNVEELMNLLEEYIEKGIDVKRLTSDLISLLKESIIFEYTKSSDLLRSLESEDALHIVELFGKHARFNMIHLLMDTFEKYKFAASPGSYFEICLLEMMNQEEKIALKEKPIFSSIPSKQQTVEVKTPSKPVEKPQNVSRETLVQPQKIDSSSQMKPIQKEKKIEVKDVLSKEKEMKLDDEFVLSLLVGANKIEKSKDQEKIRSIDQYMGRVQWMKYVLLIKNSFIVASGKNYIILAVVNQPTANEINELDQLNEFNEFTFNLFGMNKKVYAITKEHSDLIVKMFVERRKLGTLPAPAQIKTAKMNVMKEKEKTQEEQIVDLFGKENIIVMED